MPLIALLLALAAGALIALQFGVNAALRGFLGSCAFFATFVSYAVGTLASLVCLLVLRPAVPSWSRVAAVPWWAWIGGAVGVGYVTASMLLAPKLGATGLIVLLVAGQLLASWLCGAAVQRLAGTGLCAVGGGGAHHQGEVDRYNL